MLLGAIALTVVGGIWLFSKPPAEPDGARPTAVVWTTTPTPVPTVLPSPTPAPLPPGGVGVGARVRVQGTGAAGLSMRAEASTASLRVLVADEDEVLLIVGGPVDADGYTWWQLRDEANAEREGWAVEDYLFPIE